MRHGPSKANAEGIIVSSPQRGINDYGLTHPGRERVRRQLPGFGTNGPIPTVIFASDFLRTRQTAEMVGSHLGLPVTLTTALRERHFGLLEGEPDRRYADIWAADQRSADHTLFEVESLNALANRLNAFLAKLESTYQTESILLVTHGDVSAIFRCLSSATDLRAHRTLAPMHPADVLEIK